MVSAAVLLNEVLRRYRRPERLAEVVSVVVGLQSLIELPFLSNELLRPDVLRLAEVDLLSVTQVA